MYYSESKNGFFHPTIHPVVPLDAVEISSDQHAALLDEQSRGARIVADETGQPRAVFPFAPTADEIAALARAELSAAVQAHLDAEARALGYDTITLAISYADEPAVPRYQAEGQALRAWRSLAWDAAMPMINATPPAPVAALIAALPEFVPPPEPL